MAVEVLRGVPSKFRSGTTVRFLIGWNDYPATGWGLTFAMRGQLSNLSVQGTGSGTDFNVVLDAAATGGLSPGAYQWVAKVEEAGNGDVAVAQMGSTTVLPNLTNTAPGPWRTRYEAAVTQLGSLTTGGMVSVSTEGQSFTLASAGELQTLVDRLEIKAIEEDKLLGLAPQGNLKRIRMSM